MADTRPGTDSTPNPGRQTNNPDEIDQRAECDGRVIRGKRFWMRIVVEREIANLTDIRHDMTNVDTLARAVIEYWVRKNESA